MPLSALLGHVRRAVLGAQEHQDLPFERLVEALQPQRSLAHPPLFQVLMNHQRVDYRGLDQLPGLTLQPYELGEHAAKFELLLNTVEHAEGRITLSLSYAAELFDAATIAGLGGHYVRVLRALAEQPQQRIGEIALLSEGELLRLGRAQRARDQPCGFANSVLELVRQHVLARPQSTAVICDEAQMGYAQLDIQADRLARRLLAQGTVLGTRVGLLAERSIEFVVGMLGILKAGGVYVPLDPRLPADRLAYQLKDSGAQALLSTTSVQWAGQIAVLDLRVDQLDADVDEGAGLRPLPVLHAAQPVYVIYTSGSTGQPKGVVVTHGALVNYVQGVLARLALPEDVESMAMVSTVAADLGHTVLFGALCSGRTLHLIGAERAFDPDRFAAYMRQHRIDVLKIVPSHLQGLLRRGAPGRGAAASHADPGRRGELVAAVGPRRGVEAAMPGDQSLRTDGDDGRRVHAGGG